MTDLVDRSINTIRTLAMDGVQKANSGHPGGGHFAGNSEGCKKGLG